MFWVTTILMFAEIAGLLIYVLYFIAHYAHPEDTGLGRSWFGKTVVFLGFSLCYLPFLGVQFDRHLSEFGLDTAIYWEVLVFMQMVYVWALCPMTLLFYESHGDTFGQKLCAAIKAVLPLDFLLAALVVPTFFLLNGYEVPANLARIYGQEPNSTNDEGEEVYSSTFNFFWHVYAVTVWLG